MSLSTRLQETTNQSGDAGMKKLILAAAFGLCVTALPSCKSGSSRAAVVREADEQPSLTVECATLKPSLETPWYDVSASAQAVPFSLQGRSISYPADVSTPLGLSADDGLVGVFDDFASDATLRPPTSKDELTKYLFARCEANLEFKFRIARRQFVAAGKDRTEGAWMYFDVGGTFSKTEDSTRHAVDFNQGAADAASNRELLEAEKRKIENSIELAKVPRNAINAAESFWKDKSSFVSTASYEVRCKKECAGYAERSYAMRSASEHHQACAQEARRWCEACCGALAQGTACTAP
jgi:hypothetical protein